MKHLTLDLFERIVDTFHEQTRTNLKLLGHATREECYNYLSYYGIHGGLFWSEKEGQIRGVATAHPGKGDLDWQWGVANGIWTTHCVWATDKPALAELIRDLLKATSVHEFYAWRRKKPTPLTEKKLERILFYGREQNHNSSTSSTELRTVDV
jgi:hypothetical protein